MPKKAIRAALLAQRKHLSVDTCFHQSLVAQEQFLQLPELAAAATLALYSPILNEVFTEEIFHQARAQGKRVVYPRVQGAGLEFFEVNSAAELRVGNFGILEPQGTQSWPLAMIDLLLVPGVAFDQSGHRLGYGKGYYDRLLPDRPAGCRLVGLCFEFQLLSTLPAEGHDVRMDLLVTERRTLRLTPPMATGKR